MAIDLEALTDECAMKMFNMCSDTSKENRDCVMPRCCGICDKVLYCEGSCGFVKNIIGGNIDGR